MEEGQKLSLRGKLAEMMGELGYIEKRGRNASQGYDYVQAADVQAAVAKLCHKYKIAFWPIREELKWETRESSKGNALFVCRAEMTYQFADAESPEVILVPSTGEAMDSGDKAIYKAKTGALKYALIQTFLIATGDDPEVERDDERQGEQIKSTFQATGPKVVVTEPPKAKILKPCPECGQVGTIIKGRPEFGGGWLCWKSKGGCNAKFRDDDPRFATGDGVSGVGGGQRGGEFPWDNAVSKTQAAVHQEGAAADHSGTREDRIGPEKGRELEVLCREHQVSPNAIVRQYAASDKAVQTLADLTEGMYQHAIKTFQRRKEMNGDQ